MFESLHPFLCIKHEVLKLEGVEGLLYVNISVYILYIVIF